MRIVCWRLCSLRVPWNLQERSAVAHRRVEELNESIRQLETQLEEAAAESTRAVAAAKAEGKQTGLDEAQTRIQELERELERAIQSSMRGAATAAGNSTANSSGLGRAVSASFADSVASTSSNVGMTLKQYEAEDALRRELETIRREKKRSEQYLAHILQQVRAQTWIETICLCSLLLTTTLGRLGLRRLVSMDPCRSGGCSVWVAGAG